MSYVPIFPSLSLLHVSQFAEKEKLKVFGFSYRWKDGNQFVWVFPGKRNVLRFSGFHGNENVIVLVVFSEVGEILGIFLVIEMLGMFC